MAVPLILGLVLLMAIGVCALVLRISEPPIAQPPSSAPLVDVHRRKVYRIAKGIGISLLLIAACDLYRPIRPIGSVFAGILTMCAVPFLYGLHHKAVRDDRGRAALMANRWVHWRFTRAEWQAAAEIEFPGRAKPAFSWKNNWGVGLTIVTSGTAGAWMFGGSPSMILGVFVFFVLFPFGCNWLMRRDTRAQRRRVEAAPAEVRMGPDGLLLGDQYTPWASSEFRLVRAAVRAPAHLVLRFHVLSNMVYSSQPYFHRWVPLPQGAGRDLEMLQHKLSETCPRAEIALA